MMYYVRINASEGIDVNKSSRSKECMPCHYWYFLDNGCRYEPELYNGCHNILMMVYELKDIAILNIKCVDYWCIIWNMNGSDAINRVYNSKIWSLVRTKHSLKWLKKEHLEEHILEIFILVLSVDGTENHGESLTLSCIML